MHQHTGAVAESYRMEFPVGILNTPNCFGQVLTLPLTLYVHGIRMYVYVSVYI